MINSILDNDLYKFTTSYAYMKMFPNAQGTFSFIDRNKTSITDVLFNEISTELNKLRYLKLKPEEETWLKNTCKYIPPHYSEWLRSFRFDPTKIKLSLNSNYELQISVTGNLYEITLYEVPILAIISEIFTSKYSYFNINKIIDNTCRKGVYGYKNDIKFSDFGTRRRISYYVHDNVVEILKSYGESKFTGTSNCDLAMKYNLTPIGTHPHEWFMFHGAMYGYNHANYMALENWVNVYDGDLGIALTDTYTSDLFFKNFSKKHAKLFDGVRHDSGDPIEFINKTLDRYKELKINPLTKTIIFSDSLNMEKAKHIKDYCDGKIQCAFGIGTNFTNPSTNPPNVVMKLTSCSMTSDGNIKQCVKLSDVNGKHTGNLEEIKLANQTIKNYYEKNI